MIINVLQFSIACQNVANLKKTKMNFYKFKNLKITLENLF